MKLGYTVISIDDSRKESRDAIHSQMERSGIPQMKDVEYVDGRKPGAVESGLESRGLSVGGRLKRGEIGLWLSNFAAWDSISESDFDAVIVFEDDAIVSDFFVDNWAKALAFLPGDFHFMSLHIPDNQNNDYYYKRRFDENGNWELISHVLSKFVGSSHYIGNRYVSTSYQGWSTASVMYSKAGVERVTQLVDNSGITLPIDCYIYNEHFKGNLNGYALTPIMKTMVSTSGEGSLIVDSEFFS